MISFIIFHGFEMSLRLWACGGRAAPAVEAHARGLWQPANCNTVYNPVDVSIASARRPGTVIPRSVGNQELWKWCL